MQGRAESLKCIQWVASFVMQPGLRGRRNYSSPYSYRYTLCISRLRSSLKLPAAHEDLFFLHTSDAAFTFSQCLYASSCCEFAILHTPGCVSRVRTTTATRGLLAGG